MRSRMPRAIPPVPRGLGSRMIPRRASLGPGGRVRPSPSDRAGRVRLDLATVAASNGAVREVTGVESFGDPRWAEYLEEVRRVTGGRELQALRLPTPDGWGVEPLELAASVPAHAFAPWTATRSFRTEPRGWQIRSPLFGPEPENAALQIGEEVAGGADAVVLVLAGSRERFDPAWGTGLVVRRPSDLERVLGDVERLPAIVLDAGPAALPLAAALLRAVEKAGHAPGELRGCAGTDWMAARARLGSLPSSLGQLEAATLDLLAAAGPGFRVARIDGTVWSEAGASPDLQLAAVLAEAVERWRRWTDLGVEIERAVSATELRVSLDADVFEGVALLRATRRVFDRALEAGGIRARPFIEALPSRSMLTLSDVETNQLRVVAAATAGAIGGADAMVTIPFDLARGAASSLARRLARNLHLILRQESHLHRVIDPAGGSYHVEARTEAIASAAWSRFQRFESEGGLQTAVQIGRWQDEIRSQRERAFLDVAHRRRAIVGVNAFPNPDDEPPPAADDEEQRDEQPCFVIVGPWSSIVERVADDGPIFDPGSGTSFEVVPPLPFVRWADEFEGLRRRASRHRAEGRELPRVFLANLGRRADFTARSVWARNLFIAGAFGVIEGPECDAPAACAEAFADSGAAFACLCGTDEAYRAGAEGMARALADAGAQLVIVAGRPLDGVDAGPNGRFISAKDNALAFLESLWTQWEESR